jgi:hypothetical protein
VIDSLQVLVSPLVISTARERCNAYLDGEVCCTTNGEVLDLVGFDHCIFECHIFGYGKSRNANDAAVVQAETSSVEKGLEY